MKKSKKRKAVNWAAELTTAVRKIKKCVENKSCVYVHDTRTRTVQHGSF